MNEKILRLFWVTRRLVFANFICFLIALPVFTWFYLTINTYAQLIFFPGQYASLLPGLSYFASLLLQLPPLLFYPIFIVSVILLGPYMLSLFHFVLKVYEGEHVWISELFSLNPLRFKRGILLSVCLVTLLHLSIFTFFLSFTGHSLFLLFARFLSVAIILLCFLMFPYFALLLLSDDLSPRKSLKNAWILSRNFLPRGLILLAVFLVFIWFGLMQIPVLGFFVLPLCFIAVYTYLQIALIYPVLQRRVFQK